MRADLSTMNTRLSAQPTEGVEQPGRAGSLGGVPVPEISVYGPNRSASFTPMTLCGPGMSDPLPNCHTTLCVWASTSMTLLLNGSAIRMGLCSTATAVADPANSHSVATTATPPGRLQNSIPALENVIVSSFNCRPHSVSVIRRPHADLGGNVYRVPSTKRLGPESKCPKSAPRFLAGKERHSHARVSSRHPASIRVRRAFVRQHVRSTRRLLYPR